MLNTVCYINKLIIYMYGKHTSTNIHCEWTAISKYADLILSLGRLFIN